MDTIPDQGSGTGDQGSGIGQRAYFQIPRPRSPIPFTVCLLLCASLLASCTATRPVAKIGLLAPFEGLYRATGYEALAAMRAAIAETDSGALEVLPLALDTSADPDQAARALQKLQQDPSVFAVVGPLLPQKPVAVPTPAPRVQDDLLWLPHPAEPAAERFLAAIAQRADGAAGLALASDAETWLHQQLPAWQQAMDLPLRVVTEPAQVREDEWVVWLGMPAAGARFLAALRQMHPQIPFWTTTAGGDLVFYRRAVAALDGDPGALGPIFWSAQLDANFPDWRERHTPNSALAYAVYRATQEAIATYGDVSAPPLLPPQLYIFRLMPDGTNHLVDVTLSLFRNDRHW